jgi:CRISPR system Cascade subunit CasB
MKREERVLRYLAWWKWFASEAPTARGGRAELRRAGSIEEVIRSSAFYLLPRRQGDSLSNMPEWLIEEEAILATLLARVTKNTGVGNGPDDFFRRLGQYREGSKTPLFSELRFRQIQRAKTTDELLLRFRRAIDQLKGELPVNSLCIAVQDWLYQKNNGAGDIALSRRVQFRWASAYYGANDRVEEKEGRQ